MRNWPLIRQEMNLVLAGKKQGLTAYKDLAIPKSTWSRWRSIAIQRGVEALGDLLSWLTISGATWLHWCQNLDQNPWQSCLL